jgi:hypothetical protein
MTNPELDPPIEYPDSWRPPGAPPFEPEVEPTAAEVWLASLDEDEFEALQRRVRSHRR